MSEHNNEKIETIDGRMGMLVIAEEAAQTGSARCNSCDGEIDTSDADSMIGALAELIEHQNEIHDAGESCIDLDEVSKI